MRRTLALTFLAGTLIGCASPELDLPRAHYNLGVALIYSPKLNRAEANKNFNESKKQLELARDKGLAGDANRELKTLEEMRRDWMRLDDQKVEGQ